MLVKGAPSIVSPKTNASQEKGIWFAFWYSLLRLVYEYTQGHLPGTECIKWNRIDITLFQCHCLLSRHAKRIIQLYNTKGGVWTHGSLFSMDRSWPCHRLTYRDAIISLHLTCLITLSSKFIKSTALPQMICIPHMVSIQKQFLRYRANGVFWCAELGNVLYNWQKLNVIIPKHETVWISWLSVPNLKVLP